MFNLPSYREGLSKTIMEDGSGLPVITYDVPGCKDIVNKSKGGLLAKFRNNTIRKTNFKICKFIYFQKVRYEY